MGLSQPTLTLHRHICWKIRICLLLFTAVPVYIVFLVTMIGVKIYNILDSIWIGMPSMQIRIRQKDAIRLDPDPDLHFGLKKHRTFTIGHSTTSSGFLYYTIMTNFLCSNPVPPISYSRFIVSIGDPYRYTW